MLSRASFRRQPPSGQKTFTVLCLHISNSYAKKRGIGKKLILTIRAVTLDEKVDLVAGDFAGAAWRRDNSNNISIIEEAFADCARAEAPLAPHRCGVPEQFLVSGQTCVDSSNLLILMDKGKFVSTAHSPFSTKLLVPARLTRVAITRPGCTLTSSNGAANNHIMKDTIEGSS